MKTIKLAVITTCIAFTTHAFAEDGGEGKKHREHKRPGAQKLIEKFDKDGDSALNATELQAAMDERVSKMKERFSGMKDRRKKFMEKYDTDGDGKLSDAEKAAVPQEVKDKLKKRMKRAKPEGDEGAE